MLAPAPRAASAKRADADEALAGASPKLGREARWQVRRLDDSPDGLRTRFLFLDSHGKPCELAEVETLARRIHSEGPIPARDAVRLVSRLARAIERLHAAGTVHGRLGPQAVALPSPRLAQARLLPASHCDDDEAFHSPERLSGSGASAADDAFGIALTLYFALTGWESPTKARESHRSGDLGSLRPPPLAVFDAGDDFLEQILEAALSVEAAARPRSVAAFRAELDSWLDQEGAGVDDALPFLEGSTPDEPSLDVASLPPPPAPSSAGHPAPSPRDGPLFAVADEESTWRRDQTSQRGAAHSARPPRLVPPKLSGTKSKGPPPLPTSSAPEPAAETRAPKPPSPSRAETLWPPKRASPPARSRWPLIGAAGVAAVVVAGYFVFTRAPAAPSVEVPSTAAEGTTAAAPDVSLGVPAQPVPPSARPPEEASSPAPPAATPAAPSAPAAAASAASTPGPAPEDSGGCFASLFSEDTFEGGGGDSLAFVCDEPSPVKGAPRVREAVVRAGKGKVTGGMKEWAVLGFYELAGYAVLRGHCCAADVAPLALPISPGSCPPLAESLQGVVAASRPGRSKADADQAVDTFDQAVRCITRSKQTKAFGGYPRPSGGEGTTLSKTLTRARAR